MKRLLRGMINLPLTLAQFAVLTCVELFTAGGIAQTTTEVVNILGFTVALAALEIGISYGSGVLSILGFQAGARLKADPRPEQRKRAGAANTVAVLLMAVPVVFFTNALAVQAQRAQRAEYIASEAYQADRQMAFDGTLDSMARADAADNLLRASEVKTARIDGVWILAFGAAVFVYGALGWAGSAFLITRAETPWEARERIRAERAAKAKATREANAKAAAKAAPRGNVFDLKAWVGGARQKQSA